MEELVKINKSNYRSLGFSKGWYCGVPVYLRDIPGEEDGIEAIGINGFYDWLFNIVAWVNVNIRGDEGFYFKVLLECDCDEDCPCTTKCIGNLCKPVGE